MDAELSALLTERAQHYPWLTDSAYGAPQYSATATTHPCRVERRERLMMDRQGRQILSTLTVYLDRSSTGGWPNLTVRSKLVLENNSTASILNVTQYKDEDGNVDHEAAYCA